MRDDRSRLTETYISKELSSHLNLEDGPVSHLNISRLGDTLNGSLKIKGPLNKIGIVEANGSTFQIEGVVVEDILPPMRCINAKAEDLICFRNHYHSMPPGFFVKPDIVIGIQHLYLLALHFKEIASNGYQWWDSKIGPIICGVTSQRQSINGKSFLALKEQIQPEGIAELQDDSEYVDESYTSERANEQYSTIINKPTLSLAAIGKNQKTNERAVHHRRMKSQKTQIYEPMERLQPGLNQKGKLNVATADDRLFISLAGSVANQRSALMENKKKKNKMK